MRPPPPTPTGPAPQPRPGLREGLGPLWSEERESGWPLPRVPRVVKLKCKFGWGAKGTCKERWVAVNLTHHALCHLWPPEDSRGGRGPGPQHRALTPHRQGQTQGRAEGPASRLVTGKKPVQARSIGLGPPCTWAGQVVEGLRSAPWAHLRSPTPFQKASDLSGGQVHVWPSRRGAWRAECGLGRGPHLHHGSRSAPKALHAREGGGQQE